MISFSRNAQVTLKEKQKMSSLHGGSSEITLTDSVSSRKGKN